MDPIYNCFIRLYDKHIFSHLILLYFQNSIFSSTTVVSPESRITFSTYSFVDILHYPQKITTLLPKIYMLFAEICILLYNFVHLLITK